MRRYSEKAVALDPDEPTIHWLLALDHLSQRRHAEAEREARELLRIEPSSDLGYSLLAQIVLHDGRPAEAVRHIERSMQLNPRFPDLCLHVLGHAYLLLRDWTRAEDALRSRIRRNAKTGSCSRILLVFRARPSGPTGRRARRMGGAQASASVLFILADRRKAWFYRDPADETFVLEGLRKAGVAD